MSSSFKSCLVDQGAGQDVRRRVLEDAAGGLMAIRLAFLLDDPDSPHPTHDRFGIFPVKLELGREDDRLIQVRHPVGEAQIVAFPNLDLAGDVENGGPADKLADGSLTAAGV